MGAKVYSRFSGSGGVVHLGSRLDVVVSLSDGGRARRAKPSVELRRDIASFGLSHVDKSWSTV